MTARRLARLVAVIGVGLMTAVLTAAPALARVDDGEIPAHEGWVPAVLIYVIAPLGFFSLCALLVYLPSLRRKPRYRPAMAWDYDAVWFNGPDKPQHALRTTPAMQMKGGGASASW